MTFPNRPLRTGTSAPQETPYLRAAQEWDRRIGESRVQARNWRLMAFTMAGVTLILAGGLVYEANRSHVEAYFVPVDRAGKPGTVQLAGDLYRPTQAEISYFLGQWVNLMFSKPVDPVVLKQNIDRAFSYLAGHARVTMTEWGQHNDPSKDIGHQAITVNVEDVLQRSARTWQVNWSQQTYEDGGLVSTTRFTGLFEITIRPPASQATLLINPLGLTITDLSWSRDS